MEQPRVVRAGQSPVSALLERFGTRENLKTAANRDERLVASLCHLSILLNTVTYAGGIVLCLGLYLYARGRERYTYVADQASWSLVYQIGVWGIIAAGWMFYRLFPDWLGAVLFWPLWALVWSVTILRALWKAGRCL